MPTIFTANPKEFSRLFPSILLVTLVAIYSTAARSENSSLLNNIYNISGVTRAPIPTRGNFKELDGDIWIKTLSKNKAMSVTRSGGFRSPIFLPNSTKVLALQDENVVIIDAGIGKQNKLYSVPNIIKLVGFDKNDHERFLILTEDDSISVFLVTLETGMRSSLDLSSNDEVDTMISHLWGWHRFYGNIEVYEKSTNKKDRKGRLYESGRNVFMRENGRELNVSQCEQLKCGQPSLSSDKNSIVFIKEHE